MSDVQNLLPTLLSQGQPPVTFVQLIQFIALSSKLRNEILLVQPGTFNVTGNIQPILPLSVQEFISEACSIPLSSISIIWKFLAPTAWKTDLDIAPSNGLNLPAIYAKFGHSRGISKIFLFLYTIYLY